MRVLRRLRAGLSDGDAERERRSSTIGTPEHSVVTTCAYCGVGCSFKAEMRGDELVRMVPYKDGKANRGHSCVKGRFAWGYATHRERILKPMIRDEDHRSVAGSIVGRGDCARRFRVQAHPGQIRPRLGRRHHLVALHQRGNLPGAEADPRAASATTTSTPAPAFAIRRPVTAWRTTFGTSAGTQDFDSVEHTDVVILIGANPTDAHPVFASRMKKRLRAGRQAHRHRSARASISCARRISRPRIICRCCPAPMSRC